MFRNNNIIYLIILAILALSVASCDDDTTSANRIVNNTNFVATESFRYGIEVDQHARLNLEAINGTIHITGAPGADSVIVSGVKKVGSESLEDAEDFLQFLAVTVIDQYTVVYVNTEQPVNTYGRSLLVDYEIQVPDSFYIRVDAINGLVSIEAINNNLKIQNTNGQIVLADIAGSVEATLTNGQMAGDIDLPLDGDIRMSVANGDIELNIPVNTSAEFYARATNGIITISNLVLHDQEGTGNRIIGTLGDGAGSIRLTVDNGTIDVAGY